MSRATESFYNSFSFFYPLVDVFLKRQKKVLFDAINSMPDGKLLEIGVGNGAHLKLYQKHQITAIDTSAGMLRLDPNMILHLIAAAIVVGMNYFLQVTKTDWLLLLILIGLVWMAEIFNTAIEKLCDRVTREQDPLIGQVKDLASGAVFVICLVAVICAAIIYLPYVGNLDF